MSDQEPGVFLESSIIWTRTHRSLVLHQFSSALELDSQTAETLRAEVAAICAERSQFPPRSEQPPWWEEFGAGLPGVLRQAVLQQIEAVKKNTLKRGQFRVSFPI